MVAGKVCCGFFQELVLHLQFPGLPLELAQPRALANGKRRLFAGMLTAVDAHPVAEGAFVDTELLRHSGNRTRRLDHHLHGFILEFRGEALLRSGQLFHLSRRPSYWMDCPEGSGHLTSRSTAQPGAALADVETAVMTCPSASNWAVWSWSSMWMSSSQLPSWAIAAMTGWNQVDSESALMARLTRVNGGSLAAGFSCARVCAWRSTVRRASRRTV